MTLLIFMLTKLLMNFKKISVFLLPVIPDLWLRMRQLLSALLARVVSKSSFEFDLAAIMGRKVGERHCNVVYPRCYYALAKLIEVKHQP